MTTPAATQNTHAVVDALSRVLEATYQYYSAAHHHHWNVEGAQFVSLHALFEEHYQDAFQALDEIAERIRALGAYVQVATVPASFEIDTSLSSDARARLHLADLAALSEQTVQAVKAALSVASEADDSVTEDLLIRRSEFHEKGQWMMRSLLKA